jgi:predicted aspartyl protease
MRSPRRSVLAAVVLLVSCWGPAAHADPVAEVPFELVGRHIFIPLKVNGSEPLNFIFDTGSSSAVIDSVTAEKIGLTANRRSSATGAGGRVRVDMRTGNRLALGPLTIERASLMFIPLQHLAQRIGHPIDGIVGYEILSRYVVGIDHDTNTLRIETHDEFEPVAGRRSWRFRLRMNIPTIDATIGLSDGTTLRGSFLIDTGAGGTLLFTTPFVDRHDLLRRVGPSYRILSAGLTTSRNEGYEARVGYLSLFGERFLGTPVHLSRSESGVRAMKAYAGLIGNDVLRRFNTTFDYKARRMWVERNETFGVPFATDCAGLRIKLDEDMVRVVVHTVVEGSPAAEAGIEVGDEIVAINERPVEGQPLATLRKEFQRKGETVRVDYVQEGEARSCSLRLRHLR